jgi:hypothetical protein
MTCLRGLGTRGSSFAMTSVGVKTSASVPSDHRRLSWSATRPSGSAVSRSLAIGGRAR